MQVPRYIHLNTEHDFKITHTHDTFIVVPKHKKIESV